LIFDFVVLQNGGLDADVASWTFPLNHGATFVIALTGGFSGQATRTERITFKVGMSEVDTEVKTGQLRCYERDRDPERHARLGGRLGISDLFERTGHTMRDANVPVKRMSQLDYNIDYVIRKNATLSPRFNLIPIGKEKVFTGSMKWSGNYSDTQAVKITLTPPAAERECPVVAADGSKLASCPQVYAEFPLAVKPACSLLTTSDACAAEDHCEWVDAGAGACKGRAVPRVAEDAQPFSRAPGARVARRVGERAPQALSDADVQRNDAAQVRSLIQDSRLLEP
jgi:hypothetical protein